MPRSSSPHSDSYGFASPGYLESLMVRKAEKQPARVPYSHVDDTSSEDSDDSQVFTTPSTSSDLSSPPMRSPFPATRGVSASGSRHSAPFTNEGPSRPANVRYAGTNMNDTEPSTPTSTDDLDLDLYSVAGLPVLDASLAPSELPDDLIVHDAHDLPYPVRYVRVTPLAKGPRLYAVPARDPTAHPRRVAQLHLANDNRIAHGAGHSAVFRAPLTLGVAAGSDVATRARVVAKTPAPVCGSHRQLHQEARMYHAFPRELAERSTLRRSEVSHAQALEHGGGGGVRRDSLSEGSSSSSPEGAQKRRMSWREQFSRLTALRRTPRNSKSEEKRPTVERPLPPPVDNPLSDAGEVPLRPLRVLEMPPVVPKFFGYYLLLKPDGRVFFELSEGHGECGEDGTCEVAWPPAILLIEDCGDPIQPPLFTDSHRRECYRLLDGLHGAGFVAGQHALAVWTDKMLVQPGPLAVPLEARSYATPSFRLVDFGRARCRQVGFEEHWQEWCDHDLDGAFDALQLDRRALP